MYSRVRWIFSLHLIEKNKVDIYDIPIAEITEQYMEYIQAMKEAKLDSMSDFLVMAATLLKIKVKMLLPAPEEEEEEGDPREELVRRLIEYKIYKYASGKLRAYGQEAEKVFTKSRRFRKRCWPTKKRSIRQSFWKEFLLKNYAKYSVL